MTDLKEENIGHGLKVLSLFDGMSCGMIALERAGIQIETYYASEIDKYAIQVSEKNYPNIVRLGDVNNWRDWHLGEIDLIIGGSPCQGFSFAGKQLAFDDQRSKLFFTMVDIINRYKPKYFLLENVKMKKEFQDIITEYMGVEPIMINAALVSAQSRKRLFWTNIPGVTLPDDRGIVLRDILQDGKSPTLTTNKGEGQKIVQRARGFNKGGEFIEKSPTLSSSSWEHNNHLHEGDIIRKITPIECERLQGLPDNYTYGVSNSQRYKALGNAFNVDVVAHILSFIPKHENQSDL